MASLNCRLDTKIGTKLVRCTAIGYGTEIVSTEDAGRLGKSFNPMYTDQNEFSIALVFPTKAEFDDVMGWLKDYVDAVLADKADVMRVRVDSREFDRVGVLANGIEFGTHVGQITYKPTLQFIGARDPMTISNNGLSKFVPGGGDYTQYGQYFYPAGTQLAGDSKAEAWGGDLPTGYALPDNVAQALYGTPLVVTLPGPGD